MRNFGTKALTTGVTAAAAVLVCAGPCLAGEIEPTGATAHNISAETPSNADVAAAGPESFLHQFVAGWVATGSYRPECWGEGQTPCSQ